MIHKLFLSTALACLSAGAFAVCNVAPPTVTDNTSQCATSMDINPATGKPYFPSSELSYTLMAEPANAIDEIRWYLSNDLQTVYKTGSVIEILENDHQVGLIPGVESYFYAVSKHTVGTEECYSEHQKVTLTPVPAPAKPSLSVYVRPSGFTYISPITVAVDRVPRDDYYNYSWTFDFPENSEFFSKRSLQLSQFSNQIILHVNSMDDVLNSGVVSNTGLFVRISDKSDFNCKATSDELNLSFATKYFLIDKLLSPTDNTSQTIYLENLRLKNLVIDQTVLNTLLGLDPPAINNDSLVVWYFKQDAAVLKSSWEIAGYGTDFKSAKPGLYKGEIMNSEGVVVAVTNTYSIDLQPTSTANLVAEPIELNYSTGEISLSQPARIAVYSSAGACVAQVTGTILTLPQLPAGVYIAKASTASASAELVITIQ